MTQSQTTTYMSSSFPYGGTTTGLSIHEREREAARIQRERQLQNVEAVSLPTPLFPQPKKVQPCRDDRLQHTIQATLGDFNVLAPSMSHQKQYSLLGITNKVPQTPVNAATNKVFNFENSPLVKNENTQAQNTVKTTQKAKPQNRTKAASQNEPKNTIKKQAETQQHAKETPLIRKLFSEESNSKVNPTIKKEPVSSEGSSSKPADQHKLVSGVDEVQKLTTVKKEAKDIVNKHKPPKLSIQARSPDVTTTESMQASSVERILEEMTQPGPPPLTAIHTPHKNNAQFAFPYRGSSVQHASPLANNLPKKDEGTNGLLTDDLHLSDDEDEGNDKSSSEDSDSDSSDSDSESSGSDNSPLNSPVRSELNRPVKNGTLNHSNKPVKNGTLNHSDKPVKNGTLNDSDRPVKNGTLNHSNKPVKNGTLNHSDKPVKSGTLNDSDRPVKNGTLNHSDKPVKNGTLNDGNKPVKNGTLNHSDKPVKNGTLNHSDKPVKNGALNHSNKPDKNGTLNHSDSDVTKENNLPSSTHAAATSSPSLNAVGGEGVRGDEAAPPAHASLNNSPLNTDTSNDFGQDINDIQLDDFPFDLPDLPKALFDETVLAINSEGSTGFDDILSAGFDDSQVLTNNDTIKPLEKQSPKVEHKECAENGHTETTTPKKHTEKSKKHGGAMESKAPKQSKEKLEKPSKPIVKRKISTDAVKLKSNNSNSSSKNSMNSTKEDSTTKKNGKVDEMKNGKSKKSSSKLTKTVNSDGENEEIDVVTVSNDKPFCNKANSPNMSLEDSVKSKGLVKPVNGQKETTDGKILSPLPTDEITLDCNLKPDALVVKIPLTLLKRIPHLRGLDSIVISTRLENGKTNDVDTNTMSSPPRKAAKHQLSVECSDGKKAKLDHVVNGDSKDGRRHSTSNNSSDDSRRKRSPSRESDHYHSKRRRHESESRKESEKNKERNGERELENGHCKMNGWDCTKDSKSPQEHSDACTCRGQKEVEKRDSWISKLYDPEPRVPHAPDHYLHEAKRVKHHADAIKDYTSKAYKYFESVLNFVNCGKALEQNSDTESKSACQMYAETIEMLKYTMRLSGSRPQQDKKSDKRFIGLCLRLQSLLYMRLFKLRKDSMLKASKTLVDTFKGQAKNTQAPSPYNVSNPKTTGTPSPMSPTPSPSGSIGSVGSVGSAGSNEMITTPSRTNKMSSNCMTSPVNISIPQKIHTMTLQHLGFTNHMLYGYDAWEQSQMIFNEHREFFMDLDQTYGPITLQSSIVDVVEYMRQGHQRLQET